MKKGTISNEYRPWAFFLQDERFNKDIDQKTGYKTHSLVCMPVCNYDGEVIGVAQIINKRHEDSSAVDSSENHQFKDSDLKVIP